MTQRTVSPVHTRIWHEQPQADDVFAAETCHCHGYDVYGDLLGQAGWCEYLFLLFRGEAPSAAQARLLEDLSVALANPGPREVSVHAAMSAGIGGSASAACLMAALAVGAGGGGGAREVWRAMQLWPTLQADPSDWMQTLCHAEFGEGGTWPAQQHPPGFAAQGVQCALPVRQTLSCLAAHEVGGVLPWLHAQREALERASGRPLALSGVAAAAFLDLGFSPDQAEMLYLLLRLPGAAAHALEQKQMSYRHFPFFRVDLLDDPRTSAGEGA